MQVTKKADYFTCFLLFYLIHRMNRILFLNVVKLVKKAYLNSIV